MKSWLQCLAVLVMVVIAATSPRVVNAAPSVGTSGTYQTTKIINDLINNTRGVTSRSLDGGGISVRASGNTAVNLGRGLTIPVPATATAAVSAGRLAGMAAKAIKWGSWAGIASVVVPWAAEQAGIKVCPPPDFFCMPGPDEGVPPTTGGYSVERPWNVSLSRIRGGTGQSTCDALWASAPTSFRNQHGNGGLTFAWTGSPYFACKAGNTVAAQGVWSAPACPAGSVRKGQDCVVQGPDKPASEAEIANAIEKGIQAKPERAIPAYDTLRGAGFPMFSPADPVTVTVPSSIPLSPTVTVSTQTKPDGSTDTIKTTTQTEVKPQAQGSTMGNTTITYPTTTTTTTTTTNNVTNITHTTTSITNNYSTPVEAVPDSPGAGSETPYPDSPTSPTPEPEKIEIPTDYNREVTQKGILDILKGWAEPVTQTLPDGQAESDAMQAKNDEGLAVVTGITADGLGLASWFPTVPTAPCVNPQIPNPLSGAAVSFPICGYVDIFSKFISGVICFFCVLGCVHQVQSALRS